MTAPSLKIIDTAVEAADPRLDELTERLGWGDRTRAATGINRNADK